MGKKGKTSVGRAVLKHRSKGGNLGKGKESWLHTSELNDGEELNTKSVTEQSTLDEFLATAKLAGTEFVAEKLNISICNADHSGGLPSRKEEQRIQEVQDQHRQFLQIPRRPKWDERTTPEQLDQLEKDNFLAWRRSLAELQEKDDLILTPFERNLEFWRQLWRVIERSDVVVQIVDARNPSLFRCEDLESYVTEVNSHKVNVLLINKADFLTQKQRETWATYFKNINVKAVFWSAVFETERLKQMKELEKIETLPSQPEVVGETPEAVLTDSHVTQFLNLKQDPDSTEVNGQPSSTDDHELDFDGQRRISSSERDGIKHDYTELSSPMESDTMENNSPHSVDSMRNWSAESVPKESSATKYDTMRSSLMESDTLGDDPSETTQNDPKGNENVENNTKKGDTGDWEMPSNANSFRTSNDNQMQQITSSNIPSDVPKIDQLNLLPGDVISQDCREGISVNVDSGSSGGVVGGISVEKSLHETYKNDGIITDILSNLDALSDVRTGEKPGNDSSTNDMAIAGKNVEFYTSGHLLTGEELLAYCQWLHRQYGGRVETGKEDKEQQTVIGLVGYPNVGKSSTINAILQAKKVPVSSTPGRTKHFQTLLVDKAICLCDCPGLVFPSFVSTKAEMVISGILPIDQLRDHVPPVALISFYEAVFPDDIEAEVLPSSLKDFIVLI
ncbi:large subunit GTPase 1 homolog [Paramuricea clavata]|uniref:Large subunit GTPase 1 homolog n=1 Tax=Paramuricea clavata TaxID=317549 RepID=A0A6S7FNK1_PARCT|nr:large subunit GTPase 1 homolog [Paramuricea clavata]